MVATLIIIFLVLAWLFWANRSSGALQEMNAGAKLFREKRYAEAEAHFQQLLTKRLPPGVEADTRRRLALTLDVLGRTEEAVQQRNQASAIAMTATRDHIAFTAQGDLLNGQRRHDEACEMYQRALHALPLVKSSRRRAQIMEKLTTAHHQAGHSSETLKWAKASIASNPSVGTRRRMEIMAGTASSIQGDLEEAETHYFRALELAEANETLEEVARALAMLADIQRKRGHLLEALAAAQRAIETYNSPSRLGGIVEVESLREMGRFDEARSAVARMKQGPCHDRPDVERRMQATCALTLAWIETAADRPEAALMALEEMQEHLKVASSSSVWPPPPAGDEDKLGIYCDVTQMRVYAQLGQQDAARRLWGNVESRLSHYADDRSVLMNIYGQFARAAYFSRNLAESRAFWQRYLDCKPNPVGLPSAYYWLGEIYLRLAETDTARDFFRQAVAPGIDSLDARRAQARLDELGG